MGSKIKNEMWQVNRILVEACKLDQKVNGIQFGEGEIPEERPVEFVMLTDVPETKTTYSVRPGEKVVDVLNRKRAEFKAPLVSVGPSKIGGEYQKEKM